MSRSFSILFESEGRMLVLFLFFSAYLVDRRQNGDSRFGPSARYMKRVVHAKIVWDALSRFSRRGCWPVTFLQNAPFDLRSGSPHRVGCKVGRQYKTRIRESTCFGRAKNERHSVEIVFRFYRTTEIHFSLFSLSKFSGLDCRPSGALFGWRIRLGPRAALVDAFSPFMAITLERIGHDQCGDGLVRFGVSDRIWGACAIGFAHSVRSVEAGNSVESCLLFSRSLECTKDEPTRPRDRLLFYEETNGHRHQPTRGAFSDRPRSADGVAIAAAACCSKS